MHTEMRIENFVASLREDARDLTLPDRDKRALLALAEHLCAFTPRDDLAATVIAEEAELHGVLPEQLRPRHPVGSRWIWACWRDIRSSSRGCVLVPPRPTTRLQPGVMGSVRSPGAPARKQTRMPGWGEPVI
jgi:hypothetical protein